MIDAIGIASLSMSDDLLRMATISNNLANAATPGFKKDQPFSLPAMDLLRNAVLQPGMPLQVSLPATAMIPDYTRGTLRSTGNPLDLALEGDGYFELQASSGALYTRQGNFTVDAAGRLVTTDGTPVAGVNGDLMLSTNQPRIDGDGNIYDGTQLLGQLRIVRFRDPATTLARVGPGQFQASEHAAGRKQGTGVRQGFLESSNVTAVSEMVRLIETVRHFESDQKVIQGYDEMLDRAIHVAEF